MDPAMTGKVKGVTRALMLGAAAALSAGPAGAAEPPMLLRLADPMQLNLNNAIRIALKDSRRAESIRIHREEQLYRVEDIEDRYLPNWSTSIGLTETRTGDLGLASNASSSVRLPTGGSLTLSWSKPIRGDNQSTTFVLSQPLLKGSGVRLERDTVERVHMQEQINHRAFRDAAAGMVHSVIRAWRNVQSATASLKIARESLKRAERQLKSATALIEAGELAPQERVHTEAARVNRVYQVTDAERAHRNAMGHLLDVLDMDLDVTLELVEEDIDPEETTPDLDTSMAIAFERRTDWLQAETGIVFADMDLREARSNRRPDIALTGALQHLSVTDEVDWSIGVTYSKLFSGFLEDKDSERSLIRARHGVRQARLVLEETRQNIRREVDEAIYTVEVALRQIEQSRSGVALSRQRLELQERKMALGLASAVELEQAEDDLIEAQEREIESRIAYQDAVTSLDATLGTTLERWGIAIESVGR